jgi:copper/silver efflux system protein
VIPRLPREVKTEIGPDATGLGWVFQYVLVDKSGRHDLAELRSYQDWYLRYYLKAVPGVADVASVGGFEQQYQVAVDPNRLQAYSMPIGRVVDAVRSGNAEVGGRLIEFGGTEYMIRGRGYMTSVRDIEEIVLVASETGTPIRIKDVGRVTIGPDLRRGATDLDGRGEAVSGIVIMRAGENALAVIDRVKARLNELGSGLPAGVTVRPIYDRSDLVRRSIGTLQRTLLEVVLTVSAVILLFLWHPPSAVIPILTIPIALLIAFIPFRLLGFSANIMSLGGLAIAIGAMVDAAIVVVEQTHKRLEEWRRDGETGDPRPIIVTAVKEVARPSFFALLIIAASFLPVLTLEAQEGRLFKPLAYTKTLAMIVAAVLTITLDPALRLSLTRLRRFAFRPAWLARGLSRVLVGSIQAEETHPISRWLIRAYSPVVTWTLRWKWAVIAGAAACVIATVPAFRSLGSEFMPPLEEGTLLYMPSTVPGISIGEAQRLLQVTDRMLKQFPEVAEVFGKAGRAETATDPAPLSMFETIITLRPRPEWRAVDTWYSSWAPSWAKPALRLVTDDRITQDQLIDEMNAALSLPGVSNAWTMPIKGRIDMLSTGVRTPIGVKITGASLHEIAKIGATIETLLATVPGTRNVFSERTDGGYFLDFDWKRSELARHGLSLDDAQTVVQNAIGGETVSTTIEGRARYPVNVRYMRDFRQDLRALGQVLVPAFGGQRQIPVAELATIRPVTGPSMIRDEGGLLTGYVYVDVSGRDLGSYVAEAAGLVRQKIALPPGYGVFWTGQYEAMRRVKERLAIVVPMTIALVWFLLFLSTRSAVKTLIVLLAVPFSAVGAVWLLYLLGYNMSVGVWVGIIALLGIDAETGVFMLLYLDLAFDQARRAGHMNTIADLHAAIERGAAQRIRPKFMTVATMLLGLVPLMWASGAGADTMKRIAAPLVGGIVTSFVLELVVYPAVYEIWRRRAVIDLARVVPR